VVEGVWELASFQQQGVPLRIPLAKGCPMQKKTDGKRDRRSGAELGEIRWPEKELEEASQRPARGIGEEENLRGLDELSFFLASLYVEHGRFNRSKLGQKREREATIRIAACVTKKSS